MHWSGWWMFKAHLQNWDRISPPLPTPHAYHIHVEEQMGSSPTGCPVFLVTNSSSPSHKFAGALGSSSSSSLSGHPGPLFDHTVMVVKYPNNQSGTQSPSLCRKAISLLARYERRQIRLGEGNMFLVWSCSSRMFFFLSGRGVQSEVFAGSSLECRLNLEVLGHLHRAWSPHVNLLRAVATSTYDILFLGGGQGMSWSGLLASYAVPSMVLIQIVCTS